MLKCNTCNKQLSNDNFYYTGLGKRKYQYSCKPCTLEQKKQTYNNQRTVKFTKNDNESGYQCSKEDIPRIYFMYSKSELVYIGLSTSFAYRLQVHKNRSSFYKHITSIEVATLESPVEMAVYEILLINHHKPKYNKHSYQGKHNIPLPELTFEPWPLL